uniref:Leucine-rich repeat-containing protein 51 n=1 Tax=Dicentrarchus labrax TaxID=13489 RepID=A0A8P4GA70_DICLA
MVETYGQTQFNRNLDRQYSLTTNPMMYLFVSLETDCCLFDSDLQKPVSHFLAEPSQLAWLDLSFNEISHIDQVLCELRELRVLYLHGNSIYILSEVDRLGVLPHLHTITLHGNVIETNKAYRNHVISALPRLKTMDFSAVTRQERVMAKIWHHSNNCNRSSKETIR